MQFSGRIPCNQEAADTLEAIENPEMEGEIGEALTGIANWLRVEAVGCLRTGQPISPSNRPPLTHWPPVPRF
jgi:hypothetical protein